MNVSLKKNDAGWEVSYEATDVKTEQFATLDEAVAKLKELEAPATPADAV